MKNIKNIFMIIVSALLIFVGCAKVESPYNNQIPVNSKGEYAIVFTKAPTTKASVAAWSTFKGYDKFQLFTWNEDEAIMSPFKVQGEGNEYKYENIADNQPLQYFKKQYDAYNFIGIIPDNASASLNDTTVTVTNVESFVVDDKRVETDIIADSPKEFLYAQAAVSKADYGHKVTLPFKHGNALLKLSFKSDRDDTELLDYTPYNPGTPGTPGTPGDTTSTQKNAKVLEELLAGNIVPYPYAASNLSASMASSYYQNKTNYGSMSDLVDAVNSQFVYYQEDGKTLKTDAWADGDIRNKVYLKFADSTDKNAFMSNEGDTYHDAFWNNASNELKAIFKKSYDEGWRVVNISNISGNWYNARLVNNGIFTMNVITITGGSPAVPATPATGLPGIRVFSADSTAAGFVHVAHTLNAKAVVTPNTFTWENRVAATDSIQFSLPTTTVLASEQWSPTTFYAIPGDTDLNYFVVKLSYKYNGTTVYDVRVPLELPAGGLVAGNYYHYIINITSTGNGTNDPGEAEGDKDVIDIVDNPIIVTVTTTDYTKGIEQEVTI